MAGPARDDLVAHHRLAAGGDHEFIGGADGDGLVGQIVQLLEIGIAQHQPVVGVPQHEGFRDGLDGVAQAHVGGDRLLHQVLLLGDVDRDADQMQGRARRGWRTSSQRARSQTQWPSAWRMRKAWSMAVSLASSELGGELVELHVVGMHQAR